jgi:hypothetical protein
MGKLRGICLPTVRFVRTNAAGFNGVLAVITRLTPGA